MSNWANDRIFEFLELDNIHNFYQLLDEPILYNANGLDIVKQNYFDNKKPQLVLADSNPVSVSVLKKFLSETREWAPHTAPWMLIILNHQNRKKGTARLQKTRARTLEVLCCWLSWAWADLGVHEV